MTAISLNDPSASDRDGEPSSARRELLIAWETACPALERALLLRGWQPRIVWAGRRPEGSDPGAPQVGLVDARRPETDAAWLAATLAARYGDLHWVALVHGRESRAP